MITADSHKKFVLCITDAFTKYAVVTAIASKDAEMVANAIYRDWFLNSGFRPRFTRTGEKNLSINSPRNSFNYSTSDTPKLPQHILNVMPK
jgi:hypothetical protein